MRRLKQRGAVAFADPSRFDKHHTRPAPGAKLHAVRLRCDEKAPSGLALKPTDLSALLTEQIAHLRPFLIRTDCALRSTLNPAGLTTTACAQRRSAIKLQPSRLANGR